MSGEQGDNNKTLLDKDWQNDLMLKEKFTHINSS